MSNFIELAHVNPTDLNKLDHMLTVEPVNENDFNDNYMHADDVFSITVKFSDGTEMEIKCCGVRYAPEGSNTAWAEAVLFKNGSEIIHSNPRDRYRGEWEMTDNCGNTYTALVGPWANTGEKIKGA